MTCRDDSTVFSRLRKLSFSFRIIFDQSLREWPLRVEKTPSKKSDFLPFFPSSTEECSFRSTFHDILFVLIRTRCANRFFYHSCFLNFTSLYLIALLDPHARKIGHLEGYSRFETRAASIMMGDGLFLHQHSTSVSFCFYIYIHFVILLMLLDYFIKLI